MDIHSIIAHARKTDEGYETQTLRDHLLWCAEIASRNAVWFDGADWAYCAGILHDQAKYLPAFQEYIRIASGMAAGIPRRVDHKYSGAAVCGKVVTNEAYAEILQYCIAGHHGGLPDYNDLKTGLKEKGNIPDNFPLPVIRNRQLKLPAAIDAGNLHYWVRTLYSSLVDADFLDTEHFMQPDKSERRAGRYDSLETLRDRLDDYMRRFSDMPGRINRYRREILEQAVRKTGFPQGIYSMTVPTGGGKTLSSMKWALEHALRHGMRRVIVVIPYTSIIVQTANVYRDIFGPGNVVEHHSNVMVSSRNDDAQDEVSCERLLAAENWDAPVIVTTNVQFFESMHAHKPSACRKLHNICGSVVIFDEAQMFPSAFLRPVLASLKVLPDLFHSSVLLMTATQPVLCGTIGMRKGAFEGLGQVRELMDDPCGLQVLFRRVVTLIDTVPKPAEAIAAELSKYKRVLCIVNTKKLAADIFKLLPGDVPAIHLSRMMCQAHLSDALQKVRAGGEMRVVSTQLVEAGVDIDFPVVFRELAGLDSIAQAAGRCNREGKMPCPGTLHVFVSEKGPKTGKLAKAAQTTADLYEAKKITPDNLFAPDSIYAWFNRYYASLNDDFDEAETEARLCNGRLDFRTASEKFKLIDEEGVDIVVWYGEGRELIEKLKRYPFTSRLFRRLQRYTVTVRERAFKDILTAGTVERVGDIWVQCAPGLYHEETGIVTNNPFSDELLMV